MLKSNFEINLELLQKKYGGRLLIGVPEAAEIFECSEKTVQCGTHKKAVRKFPVQPVRGLPGKKFRLTDCAKALAGEEI